MPELPEVETVRRSLVAGLKHHSYEIERVEVLNSKLIAAPNDLDTFTARLQRSTITDVKRHGKWLLLPIISEDREQRYTLTVHLRMTGVLLYHRANEILSPKHAKHTHIRLHMGDGNVITYTDVRQLGLLSVLTQEEFDESSVSRCGPDAVAYDNNTEIIAKLRSTRTVGTQELPVYAGKTIKSAIMNQEILSGVGNIYANEVLYLTKLNPTTLVGQLSDEQLRGLVGAIRSTLELSIKFGGTSISDYVNANGESGSYQDCLRVYNRTGTECVRDCGDKIIKVKLDGRSTFLCPTCQAK